MRNLTSVAVMFVLSATLAQAAPPQEAVVQGLYEGVWKDAGGSLPAEVRVVALGDKKFALMARRKLADGTIERAEIPGKIDGEQVAFAGEMGGTAWKATYADGTIKGSIGDKGTLEIKRIERKPPSLGKKPPTSAVVLFDGRKFDELERAGKAPWHVGDMSKDGWPVWEIGLQYSGDKEPSVWPTLQNPLPPGWVIVPTRRKVETVVGIGEDGSIAVPKGGMFSARSFDASASSGGYDLHVEFMCNFVPGQRGQGRSNSGVYVHGGEIQVLDSFGMATYTGGGCGGLYARIDPNCMEPILSLKGQKESTYSLASLPPLQWQTFDMEFRVKKNEKGQAEGFLAVFHNGIKIHDALPMGVVRDKFRFHFQDHGNPVRYRNIWVVQVGP